MKTVAVASYTIKVKGLRKADDSFLKFEGGAHPKSVYQTVHAILSGLQTACRDCAEDQHLLTVTRLESDGQSLWGTLERGEYGSQIGLISKDTGARTYTQRTHEAAMHPFYFLMHLPDGATTGLLLLQRTGIHAAYGDLRKTLASEFMTAHPDYRLHFGRAVHPDLLAGMLNGEVYGYHVVTYTPDTDLANIVRRRGPMTHVGEVTISAKAKAGETLWDRMNPPAWYRRVIQGAAGGPRGATLATVFPNETLKAFKLTMGYEGSTRTFDLAKPEDIFPAVIVNDDVTFGADGHPTFDSIHDVCAQLADDLKARLLLDGGQDQ